MLIGPAHTVDANSVIRCAHTSVAPGPMPAELIHRWRSTPRVVATGEHDRFFPPDHLRGPVRDRLDSDTIVLTGAGHLTPQEHPDDVVALLAGLARNRTWLADNDPPLTGIARRRECQLPGPPHDRHRLRHSLSSHLPQWRGQWFVTVRFPAGARTHNPRIKDAASRPLWPQPAIAVRAGSYKVHRSELTHSRPLDRGPRSALHDDSAADSRDWRRPYMAAVRAVADVRDVREKSDCSTLCDARREPLHGRLRR
jgi:hypothetical protein